MVAQILLGAGNQTSAINAASVAMPINRPTNTANGDHLLWVIGHRGPGALVNIPAGWTEYTRKSTVTYTVSLLYKKIVNVAGEPATYTVDGPNSQRNTSTMFRCTGADDLFDSVPGALSGTSGTTSLVLPGVTPSKVDQLLIAIGFGGFAISSSGAAYFQTPAGWSTVFPQGDQPINQPPASSNSSLAVYYKPAPTTGTPTGNLTIAIDPSRPAINSIGWMLALTSKIPLISATFGQSATFVATITRTITPTFGSKATFTAAVATMQFVSATFGGKATFTARVKLPPPPARQSYPPDCSVWIDGVRFEDGSLGGGPMKPVALTDLRITWGRNNSLDQPQPASCTFEVLDMAGGQSYLDVLHIGSRVSIRATATIYPDPDVSIIPNLWPWPTYNGEVVAGFGTPAVTIMSTTDNALTSTLPPLPFTDNPSAWNGVPRTMGGQSWRLRGHFAFPASFASYHGWAATVQPVIFTGPGGPQFGAMLPDTAATDENGDFDLTFVPPADYWLGFAIRVYPAAGPAWDQIDGSPWETFGAHPTWNELATFTLSGVELLAPPGGAARSGAVFAGRITDLTAAYDLSAGGTVVQVIAQDDLAELGNRYVGDEPWAMEALNTRFGRIITASGQATNWTVDPTIQGLSISFQDVDSQPATRLLQDLAQSAGGALWAAVSLATGPFLRLEDINARAALWALHMGADGLVHIIAKDTTSDGIALSACSVLLEPVEWLQDTQDANTRVALTWQEQTTDPGPPVVQRPTERTELHIDSAAEAATGRRRVSISTRLANQAQASAMADTYLGRLTPGGWRVSGLIWKAELSDQLDADALADVMTILDGATRLGLPILLTDLPEWSPISHGTNVPLYLEGGRFINSDGAWEIELLTSSAVATGTTADLPWNAVPADWSWDEFDPSISWNDLAGVGLE